MPLKVISYNCFSLKKNVDLIKILLKKCDILMLQETLLTEDNISYVSNYDKDFTCSHTLSDDPRIKGLEGRQKGGLSIYWRKKYNKFITPILFSDRIMYLKIKTDHTVTHLMNIIIFTSR